VKNLAFFSKTNVMIKVLQKVAVILAKFANIFAKFTGKYIFFNHNNGPWTWPQDKTYILKESHFFNVRPRFCSSANRIREKKVEDKSKTSFCKV
jgi:hypothetical protein